MSVNVSMIKLTIDIPGTFNLMGSCRYAKREPIREFGVSYAPATGNVRSILTVKGRWSRN